MSITPLLPPPPRRLCYWCIFFALLAMNGPLPSELKFRENTAGQVTLLIYLLFLSSEMC